MKILWLLLLSLWVFMIQSQVGLGIIQVANYCTWFQTMPVSLSVDFIRDRNELHNYRFP